MKRQLYSDKPVSKKEEDLFQRYDFSKMIASKILESKNNDSIVMGLYGKWGEGKTSVNNFIIEELYLNDENLVLVKFNPWRFPDEITLLKSFFNAVAFEINKKIELKDKQKSSFFSGILNPKKASLKSNFEKLGDIITEFGDVASIIGAKGIANTVGKALSNVSVDDLKNRLDSLLLESEIKLVVIIDDIDRLNKEEIHAIFRLVKLTADFPNTFYILSFDKEMVAAAIAERYGKGNIQDGYNFLEKIIQVPLEIPKARSRDLKEHCLNLLQEVIDKVKIELSDDEVSRFVYQFETNFLARLKAPRLSIRYANSLGFYLSLLEGEVNNVDLMLIEAVKIFYPNHYVFIKENQKYFTLQYDNGEYDIHNSEERKEELKDRLEKLSSTFSKQEKKAIIDILKELFPHVRSVYENVHYGSGNESWYREKRIVSEKYFDRYFSYSVSKNELSDTEFDQFISSLASFTVEEIIEKMNGFSECVTSENLIHKFRTREREFDWQSSINLSKAIVKNGSAYKGNDESGKYFMSFSFNPKSQSAIFIYNLLKNHPNHTERFQLAKELFEIAEPTEYTFELHRWLSVGEKEEDKILSIEELIELANISRERALEISGEKPVYEVFPKDVYFIFSNWKNAAPQEMEAYAKNILKNPKKIKEFLFAFTSYIWSSEERHPYKVDLDEKTYEFIIDLFGKDYLYNLVVSEYGNELEKEEVFFTDRANIQTEINVLRQFVRWYKKDEK